MHALVVISAIVAQAPVTKVAVIPTQIDETAEADIPDLFDDHVLTAVQSLPDVTAIGQDDINALIGLEQQKELLGCDDTTCFAEIGGALGVDKLMAVKIARVGDKWAVTAKLMTTSPPTVENRTSNFVPGGLEDLMEAVGWIVPEVFGHQVTKPAAGGSALHAAPEPVPGHPTQFEVSVRATMFLGGAADPDASTATESELVRKGLNIAPSFAWRWASPADYDFLLEVTAGFGSHRVLNCPDGAPCPGGINDPPFLWLEAMQLVRMALYQNNERFLLLPSDRVAIEVGLGGYFMTGPVAEAGLSGRMVLVGAWFSAGVQLALGSTTGLQFGPTFGLRFGFL